MLQVSQLAGQKKELMARLQRDIPGEVKRMRQLQRENSEVLYMHHYMQATVVGGDRHPYMLATVVGATSC